MNKILVTGGAGFIASSLAEKLLENEKNFVVVVDNFLTGNQGKLPDFKGDRFKFIHCDVNNRNEFSQVMMAYQFDFVFHYAAVVGVQRTLKDPVLVLKDIDGIKNVLDLSKNTGVKRVIFSSSSEIYGEPVEYPQNEDTTPLNSRLPYAIVKNVGEAFLRAYKKEYNLDYTIFRFFNTYGPKQSKNFVISKFICHALKNDDIPIYGEGNQTRTFCYIDDNVTACLNSFYNNIYVNDVVNVGGDKPISMIELAKTIIDITGAKSKIVFLPPLQEGDMSGRRPDIKKMKTIFPGKLINLKDGILKTLKIGLFELKDDVNFIK